MEDRSVSIKKIKEGDINAFEYLFHTYYLRLCIYAEGITRNEIAAEEIVSHMFVKLWEKHEQLDITTSVESYLVSAIYKHSLNYIKHAKVEEKYKAEMQYRLANPQSSIYETDNPLTAIITDELNQAIKKAIDELPEQCREIFVLNKFDDLSYTEIAEKLGISINTVRTQLTRAMKKMRISLAHLLITLFGFILHIIRVF